MEPFDVDINIGGRRGGFQGKGHVTTPAVTSVASPNSASPRGAEGKAARRFAQAVDTLAFSPAAFAYILFQTYPPLRGRVMSIVKAIIATYSTAFDNGDYNDDTRTARRLQDALLAFEEDMIAEENQWTD